MIFSYMENTVSSVFVVCKYSYLVLTVLLTITNLQKWDSEILEFQHQKAIRGSRGTAKSLEECEVITVLPYIVYIVRYTLLRIYCCVVLRSAPGKRHFILSNLWISSTLFIKNFSFLCSCYVWCKRNRKC